MAQAEVVALHAAIPAMVVLVAEALAVVALLVRMVQPVAQQAVPYQVIQTKFHRRKLWQ